MVAYDDPHDTFAPRKVFLIDVARGPLAERPIVLHVRDSTYQFAQPHLAATEARQLAAALVALADEIEQEQP